MTWLSVNWADGQPDNAMGNEKCGFVNDTGLIGDDVCSHTLPFFCSEFEFCFNPSRTRPDNTLEAIYMLTNESNQLHS